jgi:chorismate mutase
MTLQELRRDIEGVDQELLRLIRARMDIAVRIAEEKSVAGLPTRDDERAAQVLFRVCEDAGELDLDTSSVREIFSILIRMSEDLQDRKRQ